MTILAENNVCAAADDRWTLPIQSEYNWKVTGQPPLSKSRNRTIGDRISRIYRKQILNGESVGLSHSDKSPEPHGFLTLDLSLLHCSQTPLQHSLTFPTFCTAMDSADGLDNNWCVSCGIYVMVSLFLPRSASQELILNLCPGKQLSRRCSLLFTLCFSRSRRPNNLVIFTIFFTTSRHLRRQRIRKQP
jgi:hypothetical protein